MTNKQSFTLTGCYLDGNRGHYIQRDVVELAISAGFIVSPADQFMLSMYNAYNHDTRYPHESLTELCDLAIEWLNWFGKGRMHGQNFPPAKPEDTVWEFNDGDFGLYEIEDGD